MASPLVIPLRGLFSALTVLCCAFVILELCVLRVPFYPAAEAHWDSELPPCVPGLNAARHSTEGHVDYLIVIHTAARNLKQRNAIRRTWARDFKNVPGAETVFFLGNATSARRRNAIKKEHRRYSDIVGGSFVDSYDNLTLKSIAMLEMALESYPNLTFLLKVNDDTYVNVPKFLERLCRMRVDTVHGYRRQENVSSQEHNETSFPHYASGAGYAIGGQVIERLYNATWEVKRIRMEDVYITGLCRERAAVKLVHDDDFYYTNLTMCQMRDSVMSQNMNATLIRSYWHALHNATVLAAECDRSITTLERTSYLEPQ